MLYVCYSCVEVCKNTNTFDLFILAALRTLLRYFFYFFLLLRSKNIYFILDDITKINRFIIIFNLIKIKLHCYIINVSKIYN